MKTISVTDLKLIDGLSHLNYMEMIHPDNDPLVHSYLKMMGFDVEEGVEYRAYQHRNLQGKVVVNYVLAADMLLDRVSLTSPFSTYEDRLIAASIYDRSLYETLHELGNTSPTYGSTALDENVHNKDEHVYSEEELEVMRQIAQLEDLLYYIRGNQFNPDGSVKSLEDYRSPRPVDKKRKKHVHKKKGNVDGAN